MIDVIIPAYNSHKTIIKTLGSILMQANKNELVVTIVNDGGKDYKEIVQDFSKYLNIKEIGYKDNLGPGYARQFGLDNTHEEYFTFIDSDDTFFDAYSLVCLKKHLQNTKYTFITSDFLEVTKYGEYYYHESNLTWLFGHLYKRYLINKYNIRFTNTKSGEDVYFNNLYNIMGYTDINKDSMLIYNNVTYLWQTNKKSLTKNKTVEVPYDNYVSIATAYCIILAYEDALSMQAPKELTEKLIFNIIIKMYYCWVDISYDHTNTLYRNVLLDLYRYYFQKYWHLNKYYNEEQLQYLLDESYKTSELKKNNHYLNISFGEFKKLMFEKEVKEKDIIPKVLEIIT